MIRIAVLGIAGVILAMLLKQTKPEYALYVSFGTGVLILSYALLKIQYIFESIEEIRKMLPIESSYFYTLLKMIGITYVGQFSAGICKDAGYSNISNQLELFGKLSILVLSMPIMMALLDTIKGFLA